LRADLEERNLRQKWKAAERVELRQRVSELIKSGRDLIDSTTTASDVNSWLEAARSFVSRKPTHDDNLDSRDLLYRVARVLDESASSDEMTAAINQTMAPLKMINRRLGGTP